MRISDNNTREETLKFARDEFERNKEVTDIVGCIDVDCGLRTENHDEKC